jgi:hypothetical protein
MCLSLRRHMAVPERHFRIGDIVRNSPRRRYIEEDFWHRGAQKCDPLCSKKSSLPAGS